MLEKIIGFIGSLPYKIIVALLLLGTSIYSYYDGSMVSAILLLISLAGQIALIVLYIRKKRKKDEA